MADRIIISINDNEGPVTINTNQVSGISVVVSNVGLKGDAAEFFNEQLVGTKDGINATFFTSINFNPNSLEVYVNGLRQVKLNDYNTIGMNQIDFYFSPVPSDYLEAKYLPN